MSLKTIRQNKIKRVLKRPKSFYDRYNNIDKIYSAEGGFYNPTEENYGKFYMDYQGVPSSTIIKYKGNIDIRSNEILDDRILMKNIKEVGTIIILNINAIPFDDTLLFEYSGNINKITSCIISGFQVKEFVPSIVQYDLTNIPANKSETKPEDDSIILREEVEITPLPKLKNRSSLEKLKISSRLPSNYLDNKDLMMDEDLINNQLCSNCIHFKYNFCHLWDSPVKEGGWCESWEGSARKGKINGIQ